MEQPRRATSAASSLARGSPSPTRCSSSGSLSNNRPETPEAHVVDDANPKVQAILEACRWRDFDALQSLAISKGGFLSDSLRQQAWPVLLGLARGDGDEGREATSRECSKNKTASGVDADVVSSWKELPRHRDEDQVQLDVNRAFIYYPNLETAADLDRQKAELSSLIVEVLRRQPYLCYFQGYHDICQVFLLVLSPARRAPAVARLSALRIRDFMLPNLSPAVAQLRLLPDILQAADPDLWRHLSGTQPFFALSGTLTMYAHDVQTLGEISRLFDALLAREPVFSLYVFAAIVRSRREELFDTPSSEPEMLHSILSKLPRSLDIDALLATAAALFDTHPPERLPSWRHISGASVLRTARESAACADQSLAQGQAYFDRQVRELQRAEAREKALATLWAYRRPVGLVGLAVGFGVLSFWLRRPPSPLAYISSLISRWAGVEPPGF